MILIGNHVAARIDDGDDGFEEDDWQQETRDAQGVSQSSLRADRWWVDLEQDNRPDGGRCLGIRCNIWARALRQREITHRLRGGSTNNVGWGALRWQEMVGTDEVRFGKHRELLYLPKTISNFLHEFRGDAFPSLQLPPLPSDRSRLDVHAMLRPLDITLLLRRLTVIIIGHNRS
jgi:hypothetical protein